MRSFFQEYFNILTRDESVVEPSKAPEVVVCLRDTQFRSLFFKRFGSI